MGFQYNEKIWQMVVSLWINGHLFLFNNAFPHFFCLPPDFSRMGRPKKCMPKDIILSNSIFFPTELQNCVPFYYFYTFKKVPFNNII